MQSRCVRKTFDLTGVVQGVGFRPAVHRSAVAAGLGGFVQNRSGTVRLVLEGPEDAIALYVNALPGILPSPASIETITPVSCEPLSGEPAPFRIAASAEGDPAEVLIPADLAMCPDCRKEVLDPADRRHGYPFTTCTRCGPRYTVLKTMPYDRARTTLDVFPLCDACRKEYDDPADRRFHAESTACPACGPSVCLTDAQGLSRGHEPLLLARRALADGQILAVRGVGGFLLAADAFNRDTLVRLRERKDRPHKPFAVMAPDLETIRRYCVVPPEAPALLQSPEAPIVILDLHPDRAGEDRLPIDLISPDVRSLGVMLPTSPLHLLLFHPLAHDPVAAFDFLVMTSGNRRGEPICLRNDEARTRLHGIADLFLVHDRDINLRNDDSVCIIQGGAPQVWRRARGFAPRPVQIAQPLRRCVLALGADMKNAVAVAYADRVVLSPHIGDLDTPEALEGFEQVVKTLPAFLDRRPEAIAVDLHPDMQASRFGRTLAEHAGLPLVEVQHHHAHAVACLAEHGLNEGLALVMDGTGWGPDGTVWGAELLDIREDGFTRLATFAPVRLPGGDRAVREPARQVVARLVDAGVEIGPAWRDRLGLTAKEVEVWTQQCRQGINAPLSHAAGRVFDAWAALLGCAPTVTTYEGQPAIRLEAVARTTPRADSPEIAFDVCEADRLLRVDWKPAFRMLAGAVVARQTAGLAMAAHRAIARAAKQMVRYGQDRTGRTTIALSGGVFMNRILNDLLVPELQAIGMTVLRHRQTPPGDGCIALGQAVVAGR